MRFAIVGLALSVVLSGCGEHQFLDPELKALKQPCMALDFTACAERAHHSVRAQRRED